MTDPRYTGLDGAKRLKLLEELAAEIVAWKFSAGGANWTRINHMATELNRDNERVDRLAKAVEEPVEEVFERRPWRPDLSGM